MGEKIIIVLNLVDKAISVDLEIPVDITIKELVVGLNQAYDLKIDTSDIQQCYLKSENPIALLRGNKTIKDYGLRNGSIINYTR